MTNPIYQGLNPGMETTNGFAQEDLYVEAPTGQVYNNVVIAAGQFLPVGSVIAINTTDDKAYKWVNGGANGTDLMFGVLTHAVDTSVTGVNADDEISVLVGSVGRLNPDALELDVSWGNMEEVYRLFRAGGIALRHQGYSG